MTFNVKGSDWYGKTISIDDGIEQINDEKRKRVDINCTLKEMRLGLNDDNQIIVEHLDGREFVPTDHALKQMATRMHVPHTMLSVYREPVCSPNGKVKFNRDRQDAEILLSLFKNGIRDNRVESDKSFRWRTYTDGTLRAMLTEDYNIIDNTWYMQTLKGTFERMGLDEPRIMKWRGDADTLYGNLLLPDSVMPQDDSDYGGMISVGNCEIGIRRLSLSPSIFRAICTNGVVIGQAKGVSYSKVHRGNFELASIASNIFVNLNNQIPLLKQGIGEFLKAKDRKWDESIPAANIFAQLAIEQKLTPGLKGQATQIVTEFANYEKEHRSLFGVMNAITRAGQNLDPVDWVRFDTLAGDLLNMSDREWTNFQNRARVIDNVARDKVFGIVAA